jgi:hypothetical protein
LAARKSARQLFSRLPGLNHNPIEQPSSSSLQVERFINIIPESIFVNFYLSFDEASQWAYNSLLYMALEGAVCGRRLFFLGLAAFLAQ